MSEMIAEQEIIAAKTLLDMTERNYGIIMMQAEGVTHEESLLQPPFRGNCFNWVIGHLVQSRDRMLRVAGESTLWTAEQVDRYARDSPPIVDGHEALRLEKMLADLTDQNKRLIAKIKVMSPDELDALGVTVINGGPPWSVAQWLHFLLWHEAYHLGNLEILRQLTGKNDKVI